ncbi:LOW QUALITY PROTEIN: chromate transporter-domain-containing protein [Jimgerdemannia flammicorona]|uniref:Chromate transporter-domain-containing protein n=1 Tax=Jimgerdemannia flammicorona TaxID=994334 RepID=A0A433DIP1_9FUNG|nr:LOW QUALITY PROTEIN: chromate transporter-domain-containing protein [Jimgerdemannia flammicorona]
MLLSDPTDRSDPPRFPSRLREVTVTYFPLGYITFGGPNAHVALLHELLVVRKGWVDDGTFSEIFNPVRTSFRICRWVSTSDVEILAVEMDCNLFIFFWFVFGGFFFLREGLSSRCILTIVTRSLRSLSLLISIPRSRLHRYDELGDRPLFHNSHMGTANRARTSPPRYSGRTLARDNRGVRPCDQGATSGVCGGGSVLRRAVAVSSADGVWGSASFALIRLRQAAAKHEEREGEAEAVVNGEELTEMEAEVGEEQAISEEPAQNSAATESQLRRRAGENGNNVIDEEKAEDLFLVWVILLVLSVVGRAYLKLRPLQILSIFYVVGSIIFGGGPVVIPPLRGYTVGPGWFIEREFLVILALIQFIPGPNFNFSGYLGALALRAGALLAYFGIFLPGLLLKNAAIPHWQLVRSKPFMRKVFRGVPSGSRSVAVDAWTQITEAVPEG